ncbi:reverse transcriptase domain, reverse transcriptase zinc-binding domain protein [Tanacetum coccineum]
MVEIHPRGLIYGMCIVLYISKLLLISSLGMVFCYPVLSRISFSMVLGSGLSRGILDLRVLPKLLSHILSKIVRITWFGKIYLEMFISFWHGLFGMLFGQRVMKSTEHQLCGFLIAFLDTPFLFDLLCGSLKTQDMLRHWDIGVFTNLNMLVCPFCKMFPESHNHIFFECKFPSQVWSLMRSMTSMDEVGPCWNDIVNWIKPLANKNLIISVVARLVLAATAYFIWQERNFRLFKNQSRTISQVKDIIVHNVRLKLLAFRFKKTHNVVQALAKWNISRELYEEHNNNT